MTAILRPHRPSSGRTERYRGSLHGECLKPRKAVNPPLRIVLSLDPTHPYLRERGLSEATIRTFGLGYCKKGLMRGRIAIPIHNERGELVAYAGRWAGPVEALPEEEEKYKLPSNFKKTHFLFNLHRLAPLRAANGGWEPQSPLPHLVLVEGYFGVFRLHALGIPAATLMGRSLAPEQWALLEKVGVRSYVRQVQQKWSWLRMWLRL